MNYLFFESPHISIYCMQILTIYHVYLLVFAVFRMFHVGIFMSAADVNLNYSVEMTSACILNAKVLPPVTLRCLFLPPLLS